MGEKLWKSRMFKIIYALLLVTYLYFYVFLASSFLLEDFFPQ